MCTIRAVYAEELGSVWMPYFRELNADKTDAATNVPEDFAAENVVSGVPGPPEVVVEKCTFDGFYKSRLADVLASHSIKQTLICGLVTSACVHATAQSAFAQGFCPVLVEDCCADRTRERHEAVLSLYGGYMYKLVRLESLLTDELQEEGSIEQGATEK